MKFAIDKIENDLALLENINDGNIVEVSINNLPVDVKEKDIVKIENGKYILDKKEKEERLRRIKEKISKLKNFNLQD